MPILSVPYLDQTGEGAFTGCESVSAVMLLRYLGYSVSIREFTDCYLKKAPLERRDGRLYGPDPYEAFAGDPYSPEAMGCYAPVIQDAPEKILGEDYAVRNLTGARLAELTGHIDRGNPVITWSTIDQKDYIEGPEWIFPDGRPFLWRSNEHCQLLVGYDEEHFIFNDPWENRGIIVVPKDRAQACFEMQYSQALAVEKR